MTDEALLTLARQTHDRLADFDRGSQRAERLDLIVGALRIAFRKGEDASFRLPAPKRQRPA